MLKELPAGIADGGKRPPTRVGDHLPQMIRAGHKRQRNVITPKRRFRRNYREPDSSKDPLPPIAEDHKERPADESIG